MWFKSFMCCVILAQVIAYSTKGIESSGNKLISRNIVEVPPSTRNELPCLAIGGNCLNINLCPEDRRSLVKGLCPAQEQQDIDCCDLRSLTGEACAKNGGMCVSRYEDCDEKITFFEGGDCTINEKCC
ncbi:PREDICTED: uncharacterized protein LOC106127551 [Papilio xuthus]|uniref:Uncharacterized protein LOC106127551 n=1 Tax=Papilio xuthus TaxID=66420 RepID=A0AAJ7EKN2_PAPXU|nr:PREDICTED: uncharacterized protein LOC106127551 [Papilio xuthus]